MKLLFDYIIKFAIFVLLLYGVPMGIAFLFGEMYASLVTAGVITALVFIDLIRLDSILDRYIKPRRVSLSGKRLYEIDDPSAHLFITRAPFRSTRIWVTRGLLSLLSHRELNELLIEMEKNVKSMRLSFESYLTVLGVRFTRGVHPKVQNALFIVRKGERNFTITQFILSLPALGILLLLGLFYRSQQARRPFHTNEMRLVMSTLQREATYSPPAVCPVFSNHSLIEPWPNALLTFGRPCLLSETGVNQKNELGS